MLHRLADFGAAALDSADCEIDYWYEGRCPYSGERLRLPRTCQARTLAAGLMQHLAAAPDWPVEGKMYGVLLVQTAAGEWGVLKAFSGLLRGQAEVPGWVPLPRDRCPLALAEARTLAALDHIRQTLAELQQLPQRQQLDALQQTYRDQLAALSQLHQQRRQARQAQRQQQLAELAAADSAAAAAALTALDQQSRADGRQRRQLKQARDQALAPLQRQVAAADQQVLALKRQRQTLSRQLQQQMHQSAQLINFAGQSASIAALALSGGLPTGTGDCCAPKLLQYAAAHDLRPVALAEFWWGLPTARGDRQPGQFYGACSDRCQPIMGFLLAGLPAAGRSAEPAAGPLPLLYSDAWLVAVNKPAGLLSVPGRYLQGQDSVVSRLCQQLSVASLWPVHRLDQATSGVLLLARDRATYRQLAAQFQQRQVHKVYEALLSGPVDPPSGQIDLPLAADLSQRPRQKVDWQAGKASLTRYRSLGAAALGLTRVEFMPLTGRTHQLRVHAADPAGLAAPIWGDRLYGQPDLAQRLHLHARELHLHHLQTGVPLSLTAPLPF